MGNLAVSLVWQNSEEVLTNSKIIAKEFKKQHKHVLEKIDAIIAETPEKFNKPNFRPIENFVEVGFGIRQDRAYEITKDGFMLLVMGFTGKKAMAIKIAFIEAFNAMLEHINQQQNTLIYQHNKVSMALDLVTDKASEAGRSLCVLGKQIKPYLKDQKQTIENKMQPDLFMGNKKAELPTLDGNNSASSLPTT